MYRSGIAMVASLALVGCLDDPGTGSEQGSPDAGQVDVQFDPQDDPDVGVAALTWCAPEAVPYDVGQIPPLPEAFDAATFCEATALTREDAVATTVHTFDPAGGVLDRTTPNPSGPGDAQVTWTLDEQGRVREVFRQGAEGWYSIGSGSTTYELDEQGRLVHKVATQTFFDGGLPADDGVVETVQLWDGPRLLSREVRTGLDGPLQRELTWDYDAQGRLVEARLTSYEDPAATRVYESVWRYHEDGPPASVERLVDGIVVERESWTFGEDGELLARDFERTSLEDLAAEHGGDVWTWEYVGGLDSYERARDDIFMDDLWRDALPVAQGACALLPRGPGHGYPDGEVEYQLGVARDGRPTGIGFAYGNDSYGWRYGDVAWYGHDGLGTGWGSASTGGQPSLGAEVRYAAGRMVSERLTLAPVGDGSPVTVERERVFEGERIVLDRVRTSDGAPDRELRFGRDAAGHLVDRELWAGAERLGRQTWERDAEGRALAHAVSAAEPIPVVMDETWVPWLAGFGTGPVASTSWFWRYDGDRLVERGGGANDLHEQLVYDEEGRLVEAIGSFDTFDVEGSEHVVYDDAGRVTERCTSYAGDVWNCTSTVYDEIGRVAWREAWQDEGEPYVLEVNAYVCGP